MSEQEQDRIEDELVEQIADVYVDQIMTDLALQGFVEKQTADGESMNVDRITINLSSVTTGSYEVDIQLLSSRKELSEEQKIFLLRVAAGKLQSEIEILEAN